MLCLDGRGCEPSCDQAFDLLSVAHEQGEGAATYALAMLHLKGRGTPTDPVMARQLLEQVHAQGCAEATYALAMLVAEGLRVGARVDIVGLPALRGQGQVMAQQEAGRWQVRLDAGGAKSVHERNLTVLELPLLPEVKEESPRSDGTPLPSLGAGLAFSFDDLARGSSESSAATKNDAVSR